MALLRATAIVVTPAAPGAEPTSSLHETLYLIDSTGAKRTLPIPDDMSLNDVGWNEDGSASLLMTKLIAPNKVQNRWFRLDTKTGEVKALDKAPVQPNASPGTAPLKPVSPLRVRLTHQNVKEAETTENLGLLWLESTIKTEKNDSPRVLICGDSTGGFLMPDQGAVVFHSQGALLATPLVRLPLGAYVAMRERAQRIVAISNAKQVGLGILMYSQDYDESFPEAQDINNKIDPYLKNMDLTQNFHYTYTSGKVSSTTELGYVDGPNGRAVIYGDGSVRWRDN